MRKYTITLNDNEEQVIDNVAYHASGNGYFYLWRNNERTGGFILAHPPIPIANFKEFSFVEIVN